MARPRLTRTLIGALTIAACQTGEPRPEVVCPAEPIVGAGRELLVEVEPPIREQLAACELEGRAWGREAAVEDDVGPELAGEFREQVERGRTGPRRALVIRVLEGDRARQIGDRLAEAGVAVTRVDFGRRPTVAELEVVLQDFALTGQPGLAIVSLDGLANAAAGPCLRLADACAPLTWLRDRVHALDEGLRVVTLGGQASVAALRVLADGKTIAVVTSEDGLERLWTSPLAGMAEVETFAERTARVADSGAPVRLHEPIAGLTLARADQPLPARGRVTVATAGHDVELTRAMLEPDEPAYFALIPEGCPTCQRFRQDFLALASLDDQWRFWRVAQREALAIIDAELGGRARRRPGFAARFDPGAPPAGELGRFEPRIAIATADGRFIAVDELGLPQASLWRLYPGLDRAAELDHLLAALRPEDDALELVPMLAALRRHPDAGSRRTALARLFGHADGRVRLRALDADVGLAGVDASNRCAVLAALADPDRRVRLWARAGIHDPGLDPELVTAALTLLLERSLSVRDRAGARARQRDLIATLGELAQVDESATRVLITMLEEPRFASLQGEVSRAIAGVGRRAASATAILVALVEASREPNPNVLRALAAIGPDAACAAPRLRATADDPSRPIAAREQIRDTVDAIMASSTGP